MRGYAVFHDVYDAETIQILKDEMQNYTAKYDFKEEDM